MTSVDTQLYLFGAHQGSSRECRRRSVWCAPDVRRIPSCRQAHAQPAGLLVYVNQRGRHLVCLAQLPLRHRAARSTTRCSRTRARGVSSSCAPARAPERDCAQRLSLRHLGERTTRAPSCPEVEALLRSAWVGPLHPGEQRRALASDRNLRYPFQFTPTRNALANRSPGQSSGLFD